MPGMLSITKKAGYGLVAMTHLATLEDGQVASAREIAELFGVPSSLLMNVLKELSAAGFVQSTRGARGGYRLSHDPTEISMADIVIALEGPIRFADCTGMEPKGCRMVEKCPIADPVRKVNERIYEVLREVHLQDMLNDPTHPEQN
ncbi:MAG: RrF2 family transcriptional regulator [Planctomycetota bacterium]